MAMKCCKCCLWCFEKSIKAVSAYAYVYVFMENTSFCAACWSTFELISSHALQLTITSAVQWMLGILLTGSVPVASTVLAYQSFISADNLASTVLTTDPQPPIGTSNPYTAALVPTAAVFVLSYVIARSFALVYEQVPTALTACATSWA